MSVRPNRPQLEPPDLSSPTRPGSGTPPKTSTNDPRFEAAAKLETHDAVVRGVQEGWVRVVNPETVPPIPQPSEPAPPGRRSPETSLSTKVPEYVIQQLRRRYAETGITIRNQVLLALRRDGVEVEDDDLRDERKRPRR
jgi:hypothetical protein